MPPAIQMSPNHALKSIATASVNFTVAAEALGPRGTKPSLVGLEKAINTAKAGITSLQPVASDNFEVSSRAGLGVAAAKAAVDQLGPQYGVEKLGQRIYIPQQQLIQNADFARDRLTYASRVIDI